MKDWKENIGSLQDYLATDTEMIMAFTRERILSPNDISSASKPWNIMVSFTRPSGTKGSANINNYFNTHTIKISGYSHSIKITPSTWSSLWRYPHVWTGLQSGGLYVSAKSQLYAYMISISPDLRNLLGT